MSTKKPYLREYIDEIVAQNPNEKWQVIRDKVEELCETRPSESYVKKRIKNYLDDQERAEATIEVVKPDETTLLPEDKDGERLIYRDEEEEEIEEPVGMPPLPTFSQEQLGTMIGIPFRLLAERLEFEGWKLTEDEKGEMADMWIPVLDYYLPQIMVEHGALILASISTGTLILNKHLDYQTHKKELKEKQAE